VLEGLYDLPELGTLPVWADPEFLAGASIAGLVLLLVAAFLVWRFLRKVLRVALLVGILVAGVGIWEQRLELRTCVDDCSCTLFGQQVQIPLDRNPRCQAG
jgi:hypothetical protein